MLKKQRKTFLAIPDLLKQAEMRQKTVNYNPSINQIKNSDSINVNNKASRLIAKSANKNRQSVPNVLNCIAADLNSEIVSNQPTKREKINKDNHIQNKNEANKENSRTKENRFIVKKNRDGQFIQPINKQVGKQSPQRISVADSSQKNIKSESKMRFSHIYVLSQNFQSEHQINNRENQQYNSNQASQLSTHQIQSTSQIRETESEVSEEEKRQNRYHQDQLDISEGIEQNLEMSCLQAQFKPKIIRQTKKLDEQPFYDEKNQVHLLASIFSKSKMFIDSEKWQVFLKKTQNDEKFQKALKNFMYSYFIQNYQ